MAECTARNIFNVLVVGETGTGKSSVINMIFDNEAKLKSSGRATGCTTDCAVIERCPSGYEGKLYLKVYDTVGVCESTEGTVPTDIALETFEKLLKSLEDGIHLLLFCIRIGRLSQATKDNYKLFVHTLCDNKVPCLLVITHCESEDVLGQWWVENENIIVEQLRYEVTDGISVTTKKTGKHACLEEYETSRKNLLDAIAKYASVQAWDPNTRRRKFYAYWKTLWSKMSSSSKHDPFQQYLEAPRIENGQNRGQGRHHENERQDNQEVGHVVPNDNERTPAHGSLSKFSRVIESFSSPDNLYEALATVSATYGYQLRFGFQ